MPALPATLENDAYAIYEDFDQFSYRAISHMMDNSELIWKLLKYNDNEAWKKADLTSEEKQALIYDGQDDASEFKVFMDTGISDVFVREDCIVRISPLSIYQENRTVGTLYIMMEVYSHFKVNHLSNYRTRVDMITRELLGIFNGAELGGIGRLNLDRMANINAKLEVAGQIPFKGRSIIFGNKSP